MRRIRNWYRQIENRARQQALDDIDCYYDPKTGYLFWSITKHAHIPLGEFDEIDRLYYGKRLPEIMQRAKRRYARTYDSHARRS